MKPYRAVREAGLHHRRLLTEPLYREEHRRLIRGQWDRPEEVSERQAKLLQGLLSHAFAHVPHYRRLARERAIVGSDPQLLLASLPPLTRLDLHQGLRTLPSLLCQLGSSLPGDSIGLR